MRNIEDHSKWYAFLLNYIRFCIKRIYYRKTESKGHQDIRDNEPILFAPNHQNALMDSLIIISYVKPQITFLARQDVFSSGIIKKLLKFFKILPVYRIRDGIDQLNKNKEIFNQCAQILSNKRSLLLMPEGNHGKYRRLRPLKKGLARIALDAEDMNDGKLGLKIIPTGLDYYSYDTFRSCATLRFGKAIQVSDFYPLYKENQQKALRLLNQEIRKNIEPEMIEIPDEYGYESIMALREIANDDMREHLKISGNKLMDRFDADKQMIADLHRLKNNQPEQFAALDQQMQEYTSFLKKWELKDKIFRKKAFPFFSLFFECIFFLIFSPLALLGYLSNFIPFTIPQIILNKKIKDILFKSSFLFVLSLVILYPVFSLIILLISAVAGIFLYGLAFVISLPLTGLFTYHYYHAFKAFAQKIRFRKIRRSQNELFEKMKALRKSILETVIHN